MNKIYKLIWSTAKNMYVAVCEYAKSHTKALKSRILCKKVGTGIFTCFMSLGFAFPAFAEQGMLDDYINTTGNVDNFFYETVSSQGYEYIGLLTSKLGFAATTPNSAGANIWFGTGKNPGGSDNPAIYMFMDGLLYQNEGRYRVLDDSSAGVGLYVDSNYKLNVKTSEVTKNADGYVTGGTAYSELRPADNGNYVNLNCKIS